MRPFPDNFEKIKAHNLGLIELEDVEDSGAQGLDVQAFSSALSDGVVVVDLRPPLTFAREHVTGAINLQFNRADLGDRAEMVLPENVRFVVYSDSDPAALAAVGILRDAGFEVLGHLEGGIETWKAAGKATSSMPVVTAEQLYSARGELGVVDAREAHEYRYGHIAGARLLPSMEAWDKVDEMPTEKPLAVVCGDQVRSALVASILRRAGRDARLVSGGMSDWLERGYPVEKTQKSN
ncbi:MAG TPA: rhodanese-like domain-containing protein [Actinomycetota bacterium]|nr:rhodanese-like domain-containing protein [Actinomycetota bacterium]